MRERERERGRERERMSERVREEREIQRETQREGETIDRVLRSLVPLLKMSVHNSGFSCKKFSACVTIIVVPRELLSA